MSRYACAAKRQDGLLIVGSMGREWVGDDGRIQHYNPQWVKQIDPHWHVESLDWRNIFEVMRSAVGLQSPGYLWHEAIIWDSWLKRWIILPRKASSEAYSPVADETRGTNILLLATEDFSALEQLHIGPLEPDWGFAAVRKVPGTNDTFAALKVLEIGSRTATKICVFDLKGNMLMEPPFLHIDEKKFEGLEFVTELLQWWCGMQDACFTGKNAGFLNTMPYRSNTYCQELLWFCCRQAVLQLLH